MNPDDLFSADWRQYLHEMGQHPLLAAADELELAGAMDAGRDAARRVRSAHGTLSAGRRAELEQRIDAGRRARERLFESNLRLVVSIAPRYAGRGVSVQDLIQEGNIGLQVGIDKYDWRKGFRPSTYVYWWIRQAMTRSAMSTQNTAPRRAAIVAVKLIHSAIFLVNVASILHIFWAGVWGRSSRWTGLALVAALTECVVFVANRGHCPLTGLVESLGAESGRVSDIFLPRWFADRIPQIFGPLLTVGLFGLVVRRVQRASCRSALFTFR